MSVNEKFTIMPFTSRAQSAILDVLVMGPMSGTELLEKMNMTKQGLYKALRQLLKEEVVVKEGKLFILNKTWLSRMKDFIGEGEEALGVILPLKRKTSVLRDAHALDIYWGHLFLTLAETAQGSPLFFFSHYNWAIHERPESELFLYKKSQKTGNKILITFGTDTFLNREFKKKYGNKAVQITIDETFSVPESENMCIVGDYVITTKYNSDIAKELGEFFKKNKTLGSQEKDGLVRILSQVKNPKVIIEKNAKKALVWKRRFAKNFVVNKGEI